MIPKALFQFGREVGAFMEKAEWASSARTRQREISRTLAPAYGPQVKGLLDSEEVIDFACPGPSAIECRSVQLSPWPLLAAGLHEPQNCSGRGGGGHTVAITKSCRIFGTPLTTESISTRKLDQYEDRLGIQHQRPVISLVPEQLGFDRKVGA